MSFCLVSSDLVFFMGGFWYKNMGVCDFYCAGFRFVLVI
jgi:hypothetical protein